MFEKSYIHYPTYFRIVNCDPNGDKKDIHVWDGDEEVIELYKLANSTKFKEDCVETIAKVVRVVNRLIPNIRDFVTINRTNVNISSTQYEYLYDLHDYVLKGSKKPNTMALMTYMGFDDQVKNNIFATNGRKLPDFNQTATVSDVNSLLTSNTTSLWFSRSSEMKEIICTLYVLFGKFN